MFHGVAHEMLKLEKNDIIVGGMLIGHLRSDEAEKALPRERKNIKDIYTLHA
mgnify:CR=1 FL=1